MHDAVEVELEVSGIGLAEQSAFKPIEGLVAALMLTEPAKLNLLVSETVMEVPEAPVLKLPEVAEIAKPPT